jgi:hypothetical protein
MCPLPQPAQHSTAVSTAFIVMIGIWEQAKTRAQPAAQRSAAQRCTAKRPSTWQKITFTNEWPCLGPNSPITATRLRHYASVEHHGGLSTRSLPSPTDSRTFVCARVGHQATIIMHSGDNHLCSLTFQVSTNKQPCLLTTWLEYAPGTPPLTA